MAWETRGGRGKYYTRSVRRDGRVRREYIGTGDVGQAAAAADSRRREGQEADREARRGALRRVSECDDRVRELCEASEIATRAVLLMAGYHRHSRGEWRQRRG